MKRLSRVIAVAALCALLAGCSANAGSAAQERASQQLFQDPRVLHAYASGTNDLPFLGSLTLDITVRDELPLEQLIVYAQEVQNYDPGRGVTSTSTLTYRGISFQPSLLTADTKARDTVLTLLTDPRISAANVVSTGTEITSLRLETETLEHSFDLYSEYSHTAVVEVQGPLGNVLLESGVPSDTVREVANALAAPGLEETDILGIELSLNFLSVHTRDENRALEEALSRRIYSLPAESIEFETGRVGGTSHASGAEIELEHLITGRLVTQAWVTRWESWLVTSSSARAATVAASIPHADPPVFAETAYGIRNAPLSEPAPLQVAGTDSADIASDTAAAHQLLELPHVVRVHVDRVSIRPTLTVTVEAGVNAADLAAQVRELAEARSVVSIELQEGPVLTFDAARSDPFPDLPGVTDDTLRTAFIDAWSRM